MSMENDTRLMMMKLRDQSRHSAPVRRNSTRRRGNYVASLAMTLLARLV
ncbi:hypothetical protein [Pseudodesulfovibrio sp.]